MVWSLGLIYRFCGNGDFSANKSENQKWFLWNLIIYFEWGLAQIWAIFAILSISRSDRTVDHDDQVFRNIKAKIIA